MGIREKVKNHILDVVDDELGGNTSGKSVTLHLDYESMPKLKVLSDEMKMKPTALAKLIFKEGLIEGIQGYIDAGGEEIIPDFGEAVHDLCLSYAEDQS